jgi:alkanesulfonate monooxygenase SsuD/methylene tetrahydromethanopterin reductase-like flavin-dependent oxidoreductase (luciferase family)
MVIAGSVETVINRLEALLEEIGGCGGIFLAYHDRDDDPAFWQRSYELYKNAVIPRLRAPQSPS